MLIRLTFYQFSIRVPLGRKAGLVPGLSPHPKPAEMGRKLPGDVLCLRGTMQYHWGREWNVSHCIAVKKYTGTHHTVYFLLQQCVERVGWFLCLG